MNFLRFHLKAQHANPIEVAINMDHIRRIEPRKEGCSLVYLDGGTHDDVTESFDDVVSATHVGHDGLGHVVSMIGGSRP